MYNVNSDRQTRKGEMRICVISYGTEELPAFYTGKSGFKVDCRIDTPFLL